MSEADLTRAAIQAGAEKASEAARMIESTRLTGNDLGAALNGIKALIQQTGQQVLADIAKLRESRDMVNPYLAGSGHGYVARGTEALISADQELQDTVAKLRFMNDQVEKWQRELIPVIDRDLTEQGNNAREAASSFASYAMTL